MLTKDKHKKLFAGLTKRMENAKMVFLPLGRVEVVGAGECTRNV